jgi:hypothetical protein
VVVWDHHGEPMGVITNADIDVDARALAPEALVIDVMSNECVPIEPTADLIATLHRFTDAAWVSVTRRRPLSEDTLDRRAGTVGPRELANVHNESPGRCWDCGSPHLTPTGEDRGAAFRCTSCGARWQNEGGHVQRVDPDDQNDCHFYRSDFERSHGDEGAATAGVEAGTGATRGH